MSIKDLLGDQPYVLPEPPKQKAFDGETYAPSRDHGRLKGQMAEVFALMQDGQWRRLAAINETVAGTEAAISARLRDLRKEKYGAHTVNRRHVSNGLFEYQLLVKRDGMQSGDQTH